LRSAPNRCQRPQLAHVMVGICIAGIDPQLAKRKAEELEDFGTEADAPAAKYSKEEIEVGALVSTACHAQQSS